MKKTVTIEVLAGGICNAQPPSGLPRLITAAQVNKFVSELSQLKQEFYNKVKPMMTKAGFVFDTKYYKWSVAIDNKKTYCVVANVQITFEDTDNEGKVIFMGYINKTGLLKYDHRIIKPYS